MYEHGGKLVGKITGLSEPNDAQGQPKTCSKCTGADKDKPIVGLVIVTDLSDRRYKGETIVNPADGKVYKAEVWVEDGKLKVLDTSASSTRRRRGSRRADRRA